MHQLLNAMRGQSGRMDGMHAVTKVAEVISYDPERATCRVRILPDGNTTGWIPVGAVQAGRGVGIVAPPDDGEHVLVQPVQGDGDGWAIIARLFTTARMPPVSTATGKPVQQGEAAIVTSGAVLHLVGDTVYVQAAKLMTKGEWKHEGNLELDGTIHATGDMTAGTVSAQQHVHTGVKSGSSTSGPPAQ